MDRALPALRASVGRLHELCRGLDETRLESPSYCSDWSIADVLSHLGSGAVIWQRQVDDALAGRPSPDGFAPSVWAEWDAKTPRAKADDGLVSDERLLERFEALDDEERARLALPLGPLQLTFGEAVAMRLNEHALHTWDVEVAFDESAHLPEDAATVVVDNLTRIVGFSARPPDSGRRITVRTAHPARDFTLDLSPERVQLETATAAGTGEPDLALPAEAFCRLVYGRLDDDHCPPLRAEDGVLDVLRAVLPGF
jgi:uncharacterized protein (TIGR03083 family)